MKRQQGTKHFEIIPMEIEFPVFFVRSDFASCLRRSEKNRHFPLALGPLIFRSGYFSLLTEPKKDLLSLHNITSSGDSSTTQLDKQTNKQTNKRTNRLSFISYAAWKKEKKRNIFIFLFFPSLSAACLLVRACFRLLLVLSVAQETR